MVRDLYILGQFPPSLLNHKQQNTTTVKVVLKAFEALKFPNGQCLLSQHQEATSNVFR